MLGHNRCVKCRVEYPVLGTYDLERLGWFRLIMRQDAERQKKYTGMLCPECAYKIIGEYFYSKKEDK